MRRQGAAVHGAAVGAAVAGGRQRRGAQEHLRAVHLVVHLQQLAVQAIQAVEGGPPVGPWPQSIPQALLRHKQLQGHKQLRLPLCLPSSNSSK
jgi:hypothetical protein